MASSSKAFFKTFLASSCLTAITNAFQMRRAPLLFGNHPNGNITQKIDWWLMNFLSSCSCSLPFVAISFRVFRSVLYGSFGLRHWVVRERFVIECTNPAVTKGGLFFVSLVSSYFLSFDYLISWNTRISHSQLIHLLIMIHMILRGALYQIGEESSQRGYSGYTIVCQWPVSFPLYKKKKKPRLLWMNTKGRWLDSPTDNSRESPFSSNM